MRLTRAGLAEVIEHYREVERRKSERHQDAPNALLNDDRLFQFGLVSREFRLAHRSVVVSVKFLPHALDLGIGRCFGGA